jgi:hypothetical protein
VFRDKPTDIMATIDTPPADYPPEITGYAEPWIASPGDKVAIKVSSTVHS